MQYPLSIRHRLHACSSLPSFANCLHPAVFFARLGDDALLGRFLSAARSSHQYLSYFGDALGSQESHLSLAQQRNAGTNKNWISLECINVPQPRGFVQREMAGE